ncbi:MAG: hypothetical protein KC621_15475 [Myxococcales bacterium]|nr:hypothetical protein [Myxococcales bacterium]
MPEAPPPPTDHPYARRVLQAGPDLERMVASWRPGGATPPHDHGESLGLVRIVAGRAVHRIWGVRDGVLRELSRTEHGAGEVLVVRPGVLHGLADAGGLVTLHHYAGPIDEMWVLDPDRPYTARLRGGAGAWLPADAEDVLWSVDAWVSR